MSQYSQLFGIEVRHSFFSSGLCLDIDFIPTPETTAKIRNGGMLLRSTRGGIRVFYEQDRLDSLRMLAGDNEGLSLVFKAYSTDSYFMNYTEVGPANDDTVRYFESSKALPGDDGALRLHANEYSGSEDFRPLDFPGFQGVLTSKDQLVKPTFVVKISVPKEYADGLGEGSQGSVSGAPLSYFINFQERQTIWKYYLLGEFARNDVYVADLDNSTEFEPSVSETLADQRTAFTIKSKTPLPMREQSEYRFQLREEASGNGRVLIRRLPVASATNIGVEKSGDQSVLVSEMYVNS